MILPKTQNNNFQISLILTKTQCINFQISFVNNDYNDRDIISITFKGQFWLIAAEIFYLQNLVVHRSLDLFFILTVALFLHNCLKVQKVFYLHSHFVSEKFEEYGLFQRLTKLEEAYPGSNILLFKSQKMPKVRLTQYNQNHFYSWEVSVCGLSKKNLVRKNANLLITWLMHYNVSQPTALLLFRKDVNSRIRVLLTRSVKIDPPQTMLM